MAHTLETKISSPSTIIKIITDVSSGSERNSHDVNDTSKELEKGDREHKESSSTQTSSSSSLLHKKKSHCYYVPNRIYKPPNNYAYALLNRPKRNSNTTTQKIISAKFLRVKQLQNEITEAQKKISDLQEENRTLRNIQIRQDSALRKYQSQESHLPQLMKSHEEELRVLTIKHKKLRSAYNELESRHNKQCTELMNMKDRHKHLLQISQDKHLLQREQLAKQIEEMKTVMNDLKNKIKLQSRRLDLEAKNFRYQLSLEAGKQKTLREQLKQTQDTVQKLQVEIKDKERYMANCKINQQILNKMNQLRLKMPANSGKTISRICSTFGENRSNGVSSSDDKHLNENFSSDSAHKESTFKTSDDSDDDLVSKPNFIDKLNDEKERKPYSFESGSLPSINQSNFYSADTKSNLSETAVKSPFSSYFDLDYLPKSNQNFKNVEIPIKNNSDDNNNVKLRLSFDNGTPSRLEQRRKLSSAENNFPNEFQKEDNFELYDASTEKSDELKDLDETVSWLEFHEKFNHENEYVETKVELRKKSVNKEIKVINDDNLPYDKKSALLSALREIDLENNDKILNTLTSPRNVSKSEEKPDQKITKNDKFKSNSMSLKNSI
ncbi:lebercilin [Planococcus citri]|uniref:lebercilin n=1 Tax=Planococcus citri TaxID=170843 RepID=UPI0031F90EE1